MTSDLDHQKTCYGETEGRSKGFHEPAINHYSRKCTMIQETLRKHKILDRAGIGSSIQPLGKLIEETLINT